MPSTSTSGGTVSIRFRMDGLEEAQRKMEITERKMHRFWGTTKAEAQTLRRSLNRASYAIGITISLGTALIDILGIELPKLQEAMFLNIMTYVQQLLMAAGAATTTGQFALAALMSTAAMTLQGRAILLQNEAEQEVSTQLTAARSALLTIGTLARSSYYT